MNTTLDPRAVPGRRVLFTGYCGTTTEYPGVITGITDDGALRVRLDGKRSNLHIDPTTMPPSKELVLLDEVGPVPDLPMGRFHPTADDFLGEWEGVLVTDFPDGDIVLLSGDQDAAQKALAAYAADMGMDPEFMHFEDLAARWAVFAWQPEDAECPWLMDFAEPGDDMALRIHYLPA